MRFWKPLGARRASRGALRWAMGASAISSGSWRNTASKQGTCVIFTNSLTQFQPHAWIRLNITHVPCFDAVFRHDPELIADAPIAHRCAPRLSGLTPDRFEERIPRRRNADCQQKFDRRIEEIFLQQMNNPMFHLLVLTSAFLQTVRLSSRVPASF